MSAVNTGPEGAWRRRGGWGRRGWAPIEIVAVVLGFMVHWPVGFALLAWKMVQRGGGFDASQFAGLRRTVEGFASFGGVAGAARAWGGPGAESGNAAFDEWRKAEIERLDAERRKLETAQREFGDFVTEARKARDRDEFERFMRDRPAQ